MISRDNSIRELLKKLRDVERRAKFWKNQQQILEMSENAD